MRILLFGNPGMYHSNLAEGLRALGHEVCLVSHRYGWRQFSGMDICLERRRDINGKIAFLLYVLKVLWYLPRWRKYDIVQFHNCGFLELRGNHLMPLYHFLKRHNKRIVLGVCDVDYHVLDQIINKNVLRYSEQRIGDVIKDNEDVNQLRRLYFGGWYEDFSKFVAKDCDAITPILYEYWACYDNVYPEKTFFIPLSLHLHDEVPRDFSVGEKVRIFIGLQRDRMQFKGTDIMLPAVEAVARDFPELCTLRVVENVPYAEYEKIMDNSDVMLDQLYSYTPSMNSLLAMSKGIVVVGGGEPENYEIISEKELHPIINVTPTYDSVYNELKNLLLHKERIPELKRQSVEYVRRHHDNMKVARQYVSLYERLLK